MDDTYSSGREDDEDDASTVNEKKDTTHNDLDSLHDFSKARIGMIFNSYFPLLSLERRHPILTSPQSLSLSDNSPVILKENMNAEEESLLRDEVEKEIYSRTELPFIQKKIIKDERNSIEEENLEKEKNYLLRQLPIGSILQSSIDVVSRSILLRNRATIADFANLFQADAITLGRNIFFSQGKDDLGTSSGQALYAHEMVHVIQNEDDPELQKGMIPLSRVSFLEEEAAKVEKSFLNYLKVGGQQSNRFVKDRLGNESFVRKLFAGGSFDPTNLSWNSSSSSNNTKYRSFIDDKANADSYGQKEVSLGTTTSSRSPSTAPTPINSGSLNQAFPNLQYGITGAYASLIANKSSSERSTTPLFATDSRSAIASGALSPLTAPSSSTTTSSSIDIERVSDQVYEMIMRRIRMERDRRGIK